MTQTTRRKNCKTRREWAWNKSTKGGRVCGGLSDSASGCCKPNTRGRVRIVKRAKQLELHGIEIRTRTSFWKSRKRPVWIF